MRWQTCGACGQQADLLWGAPLSCTPAPPWPGAGAIQSYAGQAAGMTTASHLSRPATPLQCAVMPLCIFRRGHACRVPVRCALCLAHTHHQRQKPGVGLLLLHVHAAAAHHQQGPQQDQPLGPHLQELRHGALQKQGGEVFGPVKQ